jgi:tetratricopeptide (TPR) repeat protein
MSSFTIRIGLRFLLLAGGVVSFVGLGFHSAWADAPEWISPDAANVAAQDSSAPRTISRHLSKKSRRRGLALQKTLAHPLEPDAWKAYEALRSGRLDEAKKRYTALLNQRPQSRDGMLGMLCTDHALGDEAQVRQDLDRLLTIHGHDPHVIAAQFLLSGGDPSVVEPRLKTMALRVDQPGPLYFALGVLYTDQQRWADARWAFQKAVALEPQELDYAFNLALATDIQGDDAQAKVLYERLLKALPTSGHHAVAFDRDAVIERVQVLGGGLQVSSRSSSVPSSR